MCFDVSPHSDIYMIRAHIPHDFCRDNGSVEYATSTYGGARATWWRAGKRHRDANDKYYAESFAAAAPAIRLNFDTTLKVFNHCFIHMPPATI